MGIDLDKFRQLRGLTYEELAKLIGAKSPSQARCYCLGITMPRPPRMEQILRATAGEVDLAAMYRRRMTYVRSHRRPIANLGDNLSDRKVNSRGERALVR